ncbi:hypothetical protein [Aureimonas ureilytica]|uniref:hypothetical protein n=1 Tax=Aureimonas ureilytica TaxID=401562 RepID=UPI00036312F6|nr:hypothetical protein [Aureimonas ureilytica]
MPTLTRLLLVLALLAGAVFSVMWALVTFVRPDTVPITQSVPIPALQERRAPVPAVTAPGATPVTPAPAAPAAPGAGAPVEGLR